MPVPKRILVISSHVVFGAIGLAPTLAPFSRAGIETAALPTVVLSNRPDFPHLAGERVDADLILRMVTALEDNGWLGAFDAVYTGYLPSAEHVASVAETIERIRRLNKNALVICDPILGDDPEGIYIDKSAAELLRSKLIPLADLVTPNRFELSWLTHHDVKSIQSAVEAGRSLNRPLCVATSIPVDGSRLANVLTASGEAFATIVDNIVDAPHGTGDLFAGFFTAEIINGNSPSGALGIATGGLRLALENSRGQSQLALAGTNWANLLPATVTKLA